MPTLIPTAYTIQFGGQLGTVVEIQSEGDYWIATTDVGQHLVFYASRANKDGAYYWEDENDNDPAAFLTAQVAADAAVTGRWWSDR